MKTKNMVLAGVVAALYVALTVVLQPISYGPMQVRISEALTVLPFLNPIFIPALYIGAMLANIFGGFGAIDIFLGSALTLVAAYLTYKMPNKYLAPLPPVIVNAFGVSAYVAPLAHVPYWSTVLWIGIGEAIACYALGLPLLILLEKRGILNFNKATE
ncbi:membrane protein [Marinitoga sp. 1135]|uniref:Putative membrane protein n=1 Tax=Marinitoga piezophila (strain DSM 14283 / JCM 11233 / KA3) TaxID=443254 RepID=H2J6C0_MARPK|nr:MULTISPECIES: QueT transporter family protein [Marinitoga]AEX86268.1 putative membrane protein [Marinitoga piezophila KA3]APT76675.1 membrane protein [Marinitoga sp. 1137]NUU96445.1 membrane protein [Marinitoga sp. 1135]NUU98366.1 membrane protein [Marinitoga sp. 1138]